MGLTLSTAFIYNIHNSVFFLFLDGGLDFLLIQPFFFSPFGIRKRQLGNRLDVISSQGEPSQSGHILGGFERELAFEEENESEGYE